MEKKLLTDYEIKIMEAGTSRTEIAIEPELYFLIAKFLEAGPCREVADALKRELERAKILPQRLDWEGNSHNQSFEELEKKYPHINAKHLLQICARIGPVLEKEVPPCIPGAVSLLGAGKQSMLRTKEDVLRQIRGVVVYSGRMGGMPFLEQSMSCVTHNIVRALQGRENAGPLCRRQVVPTTFYSKLQMYRHTLGHLSAVYCVLYDRTGRYVITGADDLLVKVWSVLDGRLLATFRGASAEIMDITVNFDNTLLAAGSLDRILRVWCFQTMSPVAVLSGHSGMITSVNFCPILCNGVNYLVSTSTDGSVAFWSHTKEYNARAVFQTKPIQYHEKMRPGQAQMICASFSPGGAFMAAGSADHHVRVYAMLGDEGPRRVLEVEAHSDTVDSIQWAHSGLKFISGSKDGTANVWHFEQQQWMHKRLTMTTKLPGEPELDDESSKKTKVTMVSWDVSDEWVITAVSDSSLKVWNARTGELTKVLRGHKDEVFVLESHPIDPRVILSAGHDGQLIIWDVLNTEPIVSFQNFIEGQGKGAVFDAKWSPDGTMLAATDSHGHLLMYGFGSGPEKLKIVPKELFFHTDYRPLIRDANNYVLDEQTQTAPHLMPPPFLVDVDGNPYPPALQRLVPGRENCRGEQLVPNIAVGASGMQEVIEGLPNNEPRSNIDRLIEALAQRQNIQGADGEMVDERDENGGELQVRQIASPRGHRPGLRRAGDVEGIRQSSGNWQRDNTTPWNKPILAKPVNPAIRETLSKLLNAMAEMELDNWRREMKRRPQPTAAMLATQGNLSNRVANRKRNRGIRHGYRTRAARGEEQEEDDIDNIDVVGSGSSVSENTNESSAEEMSSDTTTSDSSSEYSDWIADHGLNLEPPKRSKRKRVNKVSPAPSGDSDRKRNEPRKKKLPVTSTEVTEVPDIFRPSEWLTEVVPHKTPYYPQMGDEVVYFRQGHQAYIDAIRKKKVYDLGPRSEPWAKINLRAHEFVKVVGIKYEIRPPRLCCLKLALMDEDGHLTGENFTIKYHDMQDVVDFLVLRQTFDTALGRNWSEGDRFRCIIDDSWWMGTIETIGPYDEAFPESYFLCFGVRWDNGEDEKVSAWDLEAVDNDRLPAVVGGAVPVLPEELQTILYQPQPEEWPMGDREAVCRRISRGLDQVMGLAIAEPFAAPVDLNLYPVYSYVVEYPIDLSTIKARLENHFYRRITSAQFDVRYLATNAEQFNEPHSQIVKRARIITDLCLKVIKENDELDIPAVYHQLVDTYHSSDSEIEVDQQSRPSTSRQRPSVARNLRSQEASKDWRIACRQLLETLWACEDSIPFREPVDRLENPDYHHIVDTPMDLRTVKEDLIGGNYESPAEFAKDMKLIFTNSRNYNTNKRSQIYLMTIRLSAMFEEHMRRILSTWKTARRRTENAKAKAKAKIQRKKAKKRLTNGAGPSRAKSPDTSDEDDNIDCENDDDDEADVPKKEETEPTRQRRRLQNFDIAGPSTSRMTNGHGKSAAGSSSRQLRNSRSAVSSKKAQKSDSEASESEISMVTSDSSFEKTRRRKRKTCKTVSSGVDDSDSGDSYKPGGRGKQTRKNRAKNNKNGRQIKAQQRRLLVREDEEDERDEKMMENEEEEEEEEEDHDGDDRNNAVKSSDEASDEQTNEIVTRKTTRSRKVVAKQSPQRNNSSCVDESDDSDSEDNDDDDDDDDDHDEDDDDDEDDEDEDPEEPRNEKPSLNNTDSNDTEANLETTSRPQRNNRSARHTENGEDCENSRRIGKRPRYNVDSEDDEDENDDGDESSGTAPVRNRRSVKRRYYAEESEDESAPGPGISISSRGRVRKMTARARAYMREAP